MESIHCREEVQNMSLQKVQRYSNGTASIIKISTFVFAKKKYNNPTEKSV